MMHQAPSVAADNVSIYMSSDIVKLEFAAFDTGPVFGVYTPMTTAKRLVLMMRKALKTYEKDIADIHVSSEDYKRMDIAPDDW